MTSSELSRRASFIMRYQEQYSTDQNYRKMVDNTVFLSDFEKEQSAKVIGETYGSAGYGLYREVAP